MNINMSGDNICQKGIFYQNSKNCPSLYGKGTKT